MEYYSADLGWEYYDMPRLYVPDEIIMAPKPGEKPKPPPRPHEGDIDLIDSYVDSDEDEAYYRALAPNVEGPTDWSRIEHPFGKISRSSYYAHASTDTSEDHTLKNRPLPFTYKHPAPRPAPHEPKEEWLLLWDIIYNEDVADKMYSDRTVSLEEQRTLFEKKYWAPGVWPVSRIIGQRQAEEGKEYLIEWERHPRTGEEWEPTWVSPFPKSENKH